MAGNQIDLRKQRKVEADGLIVGIEQLHEDNLVINSSVDQVESKLDTLHADNLLTHGYIDGIESKLDLLHTDNVTLQGYVDGLEGRLDVDLSTRLSESDFDTKIGSLTETAPASDTASSGLNGRLQRIAQRITSLISLLPAALVGGGFNIRPLTAADVVTVRGTVNTLSQSSTASHTTPSVSSVSSIALATNSNRKGATIFNDSATIVYLKFGATASTTSFSVRIGANDYYELPQPVYTGAIHMIRGTGSAVIQITEFT